MTYSSDDLFHAHRYNEASIAEHEEEKRLRFKRLAQQAQPPANKPVPLQRPAQPRTPKQPTPQEMQQSYAFGQQIGNLLKKSPSSAPTVTPVRRPVGRTASPVEWYTSERRNEKIFLVWQSKEYVCGICVQQIWGEPFLNAVLMRGGASGTDFGRNVGWVSRVNEQDARCAV